MVMGGRAGPHDDECKRTCKQLSVQLRNQAACGVYENHTVEAAVDCPNDVQGKETFL